MILRTLIALILPPVLAMAQEPAPIASPTPPPPKLSEVILAPTFWQQTVEELTPHLSGYKFAWISTTKDGARSVSPEMTFAGQPVVETILRFADQKPVSATLLFYSRGLSKEINERLFDEQVDKVQAAITGLVGQQPLKRPRDPGSVVRADGVEWINGETKLIMEWSSSKTEGFRAEFIRLLVRPNIEVKRAIGEAFTSTNANRAAVRKFSGLEHVVKADGDVKILDVPMVDQGERGYCVVASVERVMRYYGATVDQTELAQIANSDASKGTSSEAMVESLNKLTGRLGVKIRSLERMTVEDFVKTIEDYNRAAKRAKLEQISLGGYRISVEDCYRKMDPAVYRELRLKKASDITKFQRDVQRSIDEGIPLLWTVNVGMVPEGALKQYSGGHMRLIIGYNTAKQEIIFSDSWGPGHEEKRMSLEDAWVITSGLSSLQPIGT